MGKGTLIEWCDDTVNGEIGCDGCELYSPTKPEKASCYAFFHVKRYAGHSKGYPPAFDQPQLFPHRIPAACQWKDLTGTKRETKPWLNGLPRMIFLDDLGDTFTRSLPLDWLMEYVDMMEKSPHVWLFLTKEPTRMLHFFQMLGRVPKNFWPGTTVTSPKTLWRLRELMKIASDRLWLSLEPYWEFIDLKPYLSGELGRRLAWVIAGGESEQQKDREPIPMEPDWVRDARDMCVQYGARLFLKQWGAFTPIALNLPRREGRPEWSYRPEPGKMVDLKPTAKVIELKDAERTEWMALVGKKNAGATLDNNEWRQMPAAA